MATLTERLAIVVEANADKAIAEFKTLGGATKNLSGDVGKAGGLLSNFGGTLGSIAEAAGPAAAVGAAGLAITKFASSGVAAFVDLAGQVKEFRRVAGGTAEDASRLVAAFSAVGVDATTASTGVFQLEKHLASGADKLAAFGVVAQKDAKGNTDMSATILNVADAYRRIADPVQRAALLTAAFGRQGTALIPLLGKSREEIQNFFAEADQHHAILSDDDLKKATEYKLAIHNLSEEWKGLSRELGADVVPVLTTIAKKFSDILGFIDKIPGKGFIGRFIQDEITGQIGDSVKKVGHLGEAFAGIGDAIASIKPIVDENTTAVNDLDKALSSAADADRSLADAHQNTIDAQAAYNKLLKEGAVDAEKVAAAQRSLDEAVRSAGHAQREQAKAQQEYNVAVAAYNSLPTDTNAKKLADARDKLADANDSVADASDRVKASQEDLNKQKAGDPDYQTKLATALDKVNAAKLTESQRALASVTAHQAETKALSDNADQVQTLYDKYQAIIKQHPEVALALAGNVAVLQGAGAGTPATNTPPAPTPAITPNASINSGHTTNNVTVNVNSDRQIDPTGLSRTIIWALN